LRQGAHTKGTAFCHHENLATIDQVLPNSRLCLYLCFYERLELVSFKIVFELRSKDDSVLTSFCFADSGGVWSVISCMELGAAEQDSPRTGKLRVSLQHQQVM
jgi:hypothetical protein